MKFPVIVTKDNVTLLRVYRDKLTVEEADRILGEPITTENKLLLQFVTQVQTNQFNIHNWYRSQLLYRLFLS